VKNLSYTVIHNLNVQHILPKRLMYADFSSEQKMSELSVPIGNTVEFSVKVKKKPETLRIKLESDKSEYKIGEVAQIIITVENISDQMVYNLNLEHFLPNGLQYIPGQEEHQFRNEMIRPHDKVKHVVYVKRIAEMPDTGDQSDADILYDLVVLINCGILLIWLRHKHNKRTVRYGR